MSESATEPVNVDAVARSITQDKLQVDKQNTIHRHIDGLLDRQTERRSER